MKDRILSGIQPTGELHIGNYLGSLKNFVELQDKFECYFCIVDLHSLTEDFKPGETKRNQILDLAATFLAAGLDPQKCTIFIQSHIPAHTELAWIFNTITPMGELERMTQYKDKSARQAANINVGLFDYPVLMAADILLYKPTHVPVGHDQIQHLELTNTIARKFNNKFGKTFKEIKPYMQKPLRIMSLSDPTRKMSKSEPGSFINMDDEPAEILRKLKKAVTATDTDQGSPGVENLKFLLEQFGGTDQVEDFTKYAELKTTLAKVIADYFADFRDKKAKLLKNPKEVTEILVEGAKKARVVANQTLSEVKEKIGLI